jgi:DNA-binding Lrp family transcriptional regulator
MCATGGISAGMLSAYVVIQTEVGKAGQVAQAIGGIDGVQRAEDVAGPYDVIARVQAPGMDELGRLVADQGEVVLVGRRPGLPSRPMAGAAEATVGCPVLRRLAACWAEADQVPA